MSDELQGQRTAVPDAPHLALNVDNLHKFLVRNQVEGYRPQDPPRTPDVRKFSTGQSNPTYLIDGKFVLRKQPPGSRSNKTAHRLDREFAVLEALQKTDVPAPKPIAFCDDTQVLNGQFYLMSFVKGRVLNSPALIGMTPNERRAAYRSVIETLVKLHAVDWRKAGLQEYGQCGNMYSRQLGSLLMVSDQQEAVSKEVPRIPFRDEIVRELRQRMPEDDVALVHGDFKWDNFLIHPTEPRVVAVLDWELSTIGHPLSDLTNFCGAIYYSPFAPELASGGGIIGMPDLETSGIPTEEEVVQMYCNLSGRNVGKAEWHFGLSFYFWRGAIIAQGIGARLVSGQASSRTGAEYFSKATPVLAQFSKIHLDELIKLQGPPRESPVILAKHLRVDDDYTHKSQSEATNFNESVYCNFHASNGSVGGFIRIGNRPNENFAEVTLCVYAQDAKATFFHFSRPKISSNNGWDSLLAGDGRVAYHIKRPMEKVVVEFSGKTNQLLKPWLLRDPEALFKQRKKEIIPVDAKLRLEFQLCGPVFGHAAPPQNKSDKSEKKDGEGFARSHYEQHGAVSGYLETTQADKTSRFAIAGNGLRDHSWGPRYWQAISSYRWVTCNFGSDFGLTFTVIGDTPAKMAFHVGRSTLVVFNKCSIVARYSDEADPTIKDMQWFAGATRPKEQPQKRHSEFVITAEEPENVGSGVAKGASLTIHAKVLGFVPLRNKRQEKITYLGEAFTQYEVQRVHGIDRMNKGLIGYGMSEFLDQHAEGDASAKLLVHELFRSYARGNLGTALRACPIGLL